MIYESIRTYLGQQNFALVSTNVPNICILRNVVGTRGIICVLADNTRGTSWNQSSLKALNAQIVQAGSLYPDVLFIVTTTNIERDKALASSGLRLWLADEISGALFVYENQPDDFYGLRAGIESAIAQGYENQQGSDSGNLTKHIKIPKNFPFITVILILLNVIYYVILSAIGNPGNTPFMAAMGANYGAYIFEDFELWRLLSSMFMHFGISHLASNMVYLGIAGYNLEKSIGHWKFLLIYMLSGIGSGLVSAAYYYLSDIPTLSAGASGAVYGIIGATCFLTFKNHKSMKPAYLFYRIAIMLVFVLYSSFISHGVDGAAHIGGFAFGLILALIFLRNKPRRKTVQ